MSHLPPRGRVESLDQFRGYTIVGMILVNFIGGLGVIHSVFKHNDNYFSFADSIMPSFHFAVGFSYRLTMLRRLPEWGVIRTYGSYLRRSFALVFLAVMFFGIGGGFREWREFERFPATMASETSVAGTSDAGTSPSASGDNRPSLEDPAFRATFLAQWRVYLARLLKSSMWNTFAIIGVTQIVILPFVALRPAVRSLAMVGFAAGHALLSYWFNWGFVRGDAQNWMARAWHTGDAGSWDGGFFGPLCWAVVMLAGTLACDIVLRSEPRTAVARTLFGWGTALICLAFGLSCLSRLYDVEWGAVPSSTHPREAASPFLPSFESLGRRPLTSLLAEPPLVAPPPPDVRLENYWMMSKQIPTMTFILCACGFAFAGYALFVYLCDARGHALGVFRTFGTNPLAAYCIHGAIGVQMGSLVPPDAPLWYSLIGLAAFFGATYACVRYLEKENIFIRL